SRPERRRPPAPAMNGITPSFGRPAAGKVGATSDVGQFPGTHEAFRWDAFPPEADPDTRCFGCNICGLELTGAMLKVSPVVHVIRTMERTRAGRPREIELRYGG